MSTDRLVVNDLTSTKFVVYREILFVMTSTTNYSIVYLLISSPPLPTCSRSYPLSFVISVNDGEEFTLRIYVS